MIQTHDGLAQTQFAADDSGAVVEFTIGYFDTFPLSFKNKQNKADGFIVELLTEISRKENFEIRWIHGNFPDLIEMIKEEQLDALVSTAYSEQRAQFLQYSQNSFTNVWGQVFLPPTSNIESFFDLNGKDIALMENDFNGQNFLIQCQQFEINCNVLYAESYDEVFHLLAERKVDAAVSNNLVGASYIDETGIIPSGIVFNPFKVYISAPKRGSHNVLSLYDKQMTVWRENPESFYFKTRQKWTQITTKSTIPMWFTYIILGSILFAIVSFAAALLFKKQVKRRVAELSRRETQLNQMINILPHMIFANDNKGNLFLANEYTKVFFGINDERNANIFEIVDNKPGYESLTTYIKSNTTRSTEIDIRDSEGHAITLMFSKVPYTGRKEYEKAMVTIGVDVSQAKRYEEEIEYLAHHDSLTGLPNRVLMIDRLKSSLTRAQQFNHIGSILYLDLDNFKNINDSQGHKVGDKLLKKVAHTIRETLKPGETIARLGADEFIIEIPELDSSFKSAEKQAKLVAEKILSSLKKPMLIDQKQYNLTASVGIVIYPRDGNRQSTLIQRADTAMHEAKDRGKNRIHVFEKGLEAKVIKKHQLENDLRLALKNEEIVLMYQPIYDSSTLEMAGSEVLLRWNHPTEGTIMPSEFIPIAESAQLILDIGYWTIEQACIQIEKWAKENANPFFVAVNLSVLQIRDHEFLSRITDLIYQYDIPRNYLEFEVTESILLSESSRSLDIINQLKLMGIKLSIDDFGTGYSSFEYIRKLPLDKIKIDKSFVKDIPYDNNSITIVKTILNMANEMSLEVVAEGIENEEQLNFLQQHNCHLFQGYYFSEPKAVEHIQKKFKS
jgi:polar amino acid transport system substrate-binding protein